MVRDQSVEEEVAGGVKLDVGDDAGDEFEEDEEGEVGLDFVACLDHGVRHALQDGCVAAGVHCGHGEVLDEGEFFNRQGLVQILPLDVLTDGVVADRIPVVFGGAEVHPGSVVVLVIDDVHVVVPEVLLVLFLQLGLSALQDDDLVLALFQ